jgi:limonene 1,2-monooxygenase
MIDFVNTAGVGAIGTIEDAAAQVQRLVEQSKGFGAMLLLAHEWANPEATKRSFELVAQHVMPAFQGQARATLDAKAPDGHADRLRRAAEPGVAHMTEREVAAGRG